MTAGLVGLRLVWGLLAALAPAEAVSDPPPSPDDPDLLGDVVVDANATDAEGLPPRIRIGIAAEDATAAQWVDAVAWDLELFGLYRAYVSDAAELDARGYGWRVSLAEDPDATVPTVRIVLRAPGRDDATATATASPHDVGSAHRIADTTVALLTGTPSAISSPVAFVQRQGKARRAVELLLGESALEVRSGPDELVSTIAYEPGGALVFAASDRGGAFRILPRGRLSPGAGSVYGIAVGTAGHWAVSMATDGDIKVVLARPGDPRGPLPLRASMALQPTYSATGRLAYVARVGRKRRVIVDGKPVSSAGADAQSPTFCSHPDGLALAWVEHRGGRDQVVLADGHGRSGQRLGASWSAITAIACSPDGRLLAVLGRDSRGTGLFVGNVDRWDPQRVRDADGDSLRWAPRIESDR
jgi:hypothetical protein